jgi:hypothetical protein
LDVDREQIIHDRLGMSLTAVAKKHGISRASVCRIAKLRALTADSTSRSVSCEGRLACQLTLRVPNKLQIRLTSAAESVA